MKTKTNLVHKAVGVFLAMMTSLGGLAIAPPAQADHNNFPNFIDWGLLERIIMADEYAWLENSPSVKLLQYWLDVEQDGIYGRTTHLAHRQRAMELNIEVDLFWDMVIQQNYGPQVERWRSTVEEAIVAMGGPIEDTNRFLSVMNCESMGDPDAYNASSGASGLMQHLQVYWDNRARLAGFEGKSPFDPVANIYTSAWLIYRATGGGWQHWVCI